MAGRPEPPPRRGSSGSVSRGSDAVQLRSRMRWKTSASESPCRAISTFLACSTSLRSTAFARVAPLSPEDPELSEAFIRDFDGEDEQLLSTM